MASSSTTTTPHDNDLCRRWTALSDEDITISLVKECLEPIADDLWVTAACAERVLDDTAVQRSLLELGLKRTEPSASRCRSEYENEEYDDEGKEEPSADTKEQLKRSMFIAHLRDVPADAQLCHMRAILLDRLDRLNTFVEICREALSSDNMQVDSGEDEEWEDDPWADGTQPTPASSRATSPIPLSEFLTIGLLDLARFFASLGLHSAVDFLLRRHGPSLWPYRLFILESFPEQLPPSEYYDLLPRFDAALGVEEVPSFIPWRIENDWTEKDVFRALLASSEVPVLLEAPRDSVLSEPHPSPLSEDALSNWYRTRIRHTITTTGVLDNSLSLIQYAASQGLQGLDEIAEDLLLLSRMVYDVPHPDAEALSSEWTLEWWKSLSPAEAINQFLSHATRDTIAMLVQKVVNPYLFVLEAREERRGRPDPTIPTRLLYDYILRAPLDIVAGIFEASKPTLPPSHRLLRNDEDMARLALACLYGSDSLEDWPTMSQVFECLPAWNVQENDDEGDEADTTIASLAAYVVPSTSQPHVTPSDIYVFFRPLPLTALSRALDFLDVHLESGEIFSRWNVAAPLRWFLQSCNNASEQYAWANRMARRAGGSEDRLESSEDWEWLLEDMVKLSGSGDSGLKGAFCLLNREEILRIFLSGLLSSGQFSIAHNMLYGHKPVLKMDPATVEEISLSVSQEFYDNAPSGNYHFGDMKLAYDCLDVPRASPRTVKEKEFIEATSRLCAYNLVSRPGIPITPIEIRLSKDRLSLVSRVLSSNNDAYKHVQVILELVHKLGFKDDPVAEVKALAMLADTAINVEDFAYAYQTSEMMVKKVQELRATHSAEDSQVLRASEVCWVSCFQLGRHPEFDDMQKKMMMLGRALELTPAETLGDVLAAWSRVEGEDLAQRKEKRRDASDASHPGKRASAGTFVPSSLASRLQQLQIPSIPSSPITHAPDAAALANKALHSVAANLPFGARGRSLFSQPGDRSRSSSRYDGAEVSAQATRVLQKGLGWLLGDENS